MKYWDYLKKTALLGTEKMPLETEFLPESIKEILSKTEVKDVEGHFLKASGMLFKFEEAGVSPEKYTLPELATEQDETSEYCPSAMVKQWKIVLDDEPFNAHLFDYLLTVNAQKKWVLVPELIVDVLNKANKNNLEKIHEVLGVRGKWLSGFKKEWQIEAEKEKAWEEGSVAERKAWFVEARALDPDRARKAFADTWNKESVREAKEILNLMFNNLSLEDEAFLEEKYNELNKPDPKPLVQDTLQIINRLRAGIYNSTFGREIFEALKPVIRSKKQPILPEKETDFWNGEAMFNNFGFEKLSTIKGVSDFEYWFSELIAILHPKWIIDWFEGDKKKLILFFEGGENNKTISKLKSIFTSKVSNNNSAAKLNVNGKQLYLWSLSKSMQMATSEEVAEFLLQAPKDEISWQELLGKLSTEMQAQILNNHQYKDLETVKKMTYMNSESWSSACSLNAISIFLNEIKQQQYYYIFSDKDFIMRLALKFNKDAVNSAIHAAEQIENESVKKYWLDAFAYPLVQQVNQRIEIDKIINKGN